MDTVSKLFWLFLAYSFLGWLLETVTAAATKKRFINRGFLNGPLCCVYGIAGVLITVVLRDLKGNWVFLYLGSTVFASLTEWTAGALLEHLGAGKWWDYSKEKWNLSGRVCLKTSLLWGALGVLAMTFGNPFLLGILELLPVPLKNILLLASLGIVLLDTLGSLAAIHRLRGAERLRSANERIDIATQNLGDRITGAVVRRLEHAHPQAGRRREKAAKTVFAQGCGFQKLFMLLLIGAALGDIVETVFVFLTSGVVMSRSSLVWGQFSLVWGIAMAAATAILYRYREKSDSFLFLTGVVLGGAYEYFCSVFTELAFGTVFWDYSKIPFNLGGRINLLYCFFWGIAAVVWLKLVYPFLSRWIEKIPIKAGNVLTVVLAVFLATDILVTCAALRRYGQRLQGIPPQNAAESFVDQAFPDSWMENRYQNMQLAK